LKRRIYICKDCPSCEKVIAFVISQNINVQVINVEEDAEELPVIYIFPAYFEGNKLIAYGEDIITRLENAA